MVRAGIRDRFNSSDEDSDGRLSLKEFRELQWPVEANAATQSDFFTLCDLNKDTFVDVGELETVLTYIHKLTGPPSPSPNVLPSPSPSLSLL